MAKGLSLDGIDGHVNLGRSVSVRPTGAFTFTTHFTFVNPPRGIQTTIASLMQLVRVARQQVVIVYKFTMMQPSIRFVPWSLL